MRLLRTCAVAGSTMLGLLALGVAADPARAAAAPDLATAATFAVLAASTVTNTGPTTVSGDLGVSPGTAVTGFGPGTVTAGTIHTADAVARTAQDDLTTAYNTAAGLPATSQVTADLGGQRLVPGVYAGPTLSLTGALTLDAGGVADAVFVFQAGSTLITATASSVVLLGGADPCNVFWQVGSSATLGTASSFAGSVLALASVTANTGAAVQGRLLARTGAVTLDSNTITRPLCAAAVAAPSPAPSSPSPATPASPTPTFTAPAASTTDAPASPTASPTTPPSSAPPSSSAPSSAPPLELPSSTPPLATPAATASAAPAAAPAPDTAVAPAVGPQAGAGTASGSGSGSGTTIGTATTTPEATTTQADLVLAAVAAPGSTSASTLPRTGVPVTALAGWALLLMALGLLALAGAATPRGARSCG